MNGNRRAYFSVLACLSLAGACQNLDPNASSGGAGTSAPPSTQPLTTWQVCGSPACDSPEGGVPIRFDTPVIYLPDGATTSSPCDAIEQESIAIRQTYCAGCHAAPASQAGLSFILDDTRLTTGLSQTAVLADGTPQRLLVPGDPYRSRLYQRVAKSLSGSPAGMPPTAQPGYPVIPRPSVSDVSVLYAWIVACVPGADGGGYVTGGASYGPSAPGGDDAGAGGGDAGTSDGGGA